jgi:hypothetical protein
MTANESAEHRVVKTVAGLSCPSSLKEPKDHRCVPARLSVWLFNILSCTGTGGSRPRIYAVPERTESHTGDWVGRIILAGGRVAPPEIRPSRARASLTSPTVSSLWSA